MSGRNILLTGIPRSGTTLACRMLGQCRTSVSLFEPMDVRKLPAGNRAGALEQVDAFCHAARTSLLAQGVAPSKQREGRVPDNPFTSPGPDGARALQVSPGLVRLDAPPPPGFTLVVKHNAAFTALLPDLAEGREVLAIIRNPLAVLASWQTVDLPVRDGHIPAGERLDPALHARLAAEPDRLERQLDVLDWGFSRFLRCLPGERVLRYEDIMLSQGTCLFEQARLNCLAPERLEERNANNAWRGVDVAGLASRLQDREGAWRSWYPDAAIETLSGRMLAAWGQA